MQASYTLNYLKTYFWQGISIVLNLMAMFIVVPRLSEFPSIYGIYSIVVSLSIFLNYADLGFFSAALKYASESYSNNNLSDEIEITAFACFILLIFVFFFAIVFWGLSISPQLLIRNLNESNKIDTASYLLKIFALFSPVIIFQRLLQIIYSVRIEEFVNQRIQIAANLLKILSVLYFFKKGSYDIVGYYFFFQVMNLIACIVSAIISRKRFGYDYLFFLQSLKFRRNLFNKTKSLSLTSFYSAITHVLYYELDFFIIGKILGPEKAAIYAVGFALQSFIRGLFGVLYTPFYARFNHFIGQKDENALTGLLQAIMVITIPVVVFPVLCMTLLMKPLIFCWVGSHYALSIPVAQFLVLSSIYSFISYPAGGMLIAREKIKLLYFTSSILPIVYWAGVLATIGTMGINSFAMSKFISISSVNVIFLYFIVNELNIKFKSLLKFVFKPIIIPSVLLLVSLIYIEPFFPVQKDKYNLLIVVATGGLLSFFAFLLYAAGSNQFRNNMKNLSDNIFKRKN